MLDIGIDFGSTYSIVSIYRHELEQPEARPLTEGGGAVVPTVLAMRPDGSKIRIGQAAKEGGLMSLRRFRGFKMMLGEDDPGRLKKRGYSEAFMPEKITELYLKELLSKVLERENEKEIHQLVIGAPEVWYDAFSSIDGRTKLRNLARRLPFFAPGSRDDAVRIVSEPAAASAYFAYNYQKLRKENFSGNILLIDYGGGTLDISLTNIAQTADQKGTGSVMEIRVLNHAGAGENEQMGEIGQAGIIYMESLAKKAILQANPDIQEVPLDDNFYEVVDDIEKTLMNSTSDIEEIFNEYGSDPKYLDEDHMDSDYLLTRVSYDGNKIPVSFQMMAEVYDSVIRPVFDKELTKFREYMDREGIDWKTRTNHHFKIVLVGGFGKFALVKMQANQFFGISSLDLRTRDIMLNEEARERAISLGCALLSANVVRMHNSAPIGIGVATMTGNGKESHYTLSFGIRYHQEIEFGKEYLQVRSNTYGAHPAKNPQPEYVLLSGLDKFIVDMGTGPLPLIPKKMFLNSLKQAAANRLLVYFGFSFDASGVITLYIHDYDYISRKETNCESFELTSYKELFETQSVDTVELEKIRQAMQALNVKR